MRTPRFGVKISRMETLSRTWKIELRTLASTTLTDQQFLMGQREGRPVTLTAALRLPPGTGRVPAVVLMHGSGGLSGNVDDWARLLTDLGVATFAPDCFTGRGIDVTFGNQGVLGRLAMIVDAYRAFDVLASHPRIDPQRIALMGFSRGGQASLYAAVQRFRDMHGPSKGDFAGYVSFYPACHIRYRDDERLVDRPVTVLHGTADDMNPIQMCRDYVARVRQAGGRIEMHEYAGARHIFDWPLLARPVILQGVRSNSGALLVEREQGAIFLNETDISEAAAIERFALNPSLAYDAAAFTDSKRVVTDFIRSVLQN